MNHPTYVIVNTLDDRRDRGIRLIVAERVDHIGGTLPRLDTEAVEYLEIAQFTGPEAFRDACAFVEAREGSSQVQTGVAP